MTEIFISYKKILFLTFLLASFTCISGQLKPLTNPAYRYYARPGFVNTTEVTCAPGIMDVTTPNSEYYYGITNLFGYQIDDNFSGGLGLGIYKFDESELFPVYIQYRYNIYLKRITHFIYGDGGVLFYLMDAYSSRIFINPGMGLARSITNKVEVQVSAGLMIQARSVFGDATFVNFRIGVAFREEGYRMFRNGGF